MYFKQPGFFNPTIRWLKVTPITSWRRTDRFSWSDQKDCFQVRREFVLRARKGQTENITDTEVAQYRNLAEKEWGKYLPGTLISEPRFIPGTRRKRLPLFIHEFGVPREAGWIDEHGVHRYPTPRPANMTTIQNAYDRFSTQRFALPSASRLDELWSVRIRVLTFPEDYRRFLSQYNGGYFNEPEITPVNQGCPLVMLTCLYGIGASHPYAELAQPSDLVLFEGNDPPKISADWRHPDELVDYPRDRARRSRRVYS